MSDPTQYDAIAERYSGVENLLIRKYAEYPLFFDKLGDLDGLDVLDLACGTGFYSRAAKQRGARRVVGVDSSPLIIEQAERTTGLELEIEYLVYDVASMPNLGAFDVVTAAFLLNYAPTREVLARMCQTIAAHLRPGGRLVGNLPRSRYDRSRPHTPKYELVYSCPDELDEGDEFAFTVYAGAPLTIYQRWWTEGTYRSALEDVGLTAVQFYPWQPNDAALQQFGTEFWADWVANPLTQVVTARMRT